MNSIVRYIAFWLHDFAIAVERKLSPYLGLKTSYEIIVAYDREVEKQVAAQVYMYDGQGYPYFMQGSEAHEVCSLVTAEDLRRWFPRKELKCEIKGCRSSRGPHTSAQHYLTSVTNYIKDAHNGITAFYVIEEAINREAMLAGGGVVLSKEEAIVARKLIANHIVGPAGRAVIAKLNAVQE